MCRYLFELNLVTHESIFNKRKKVLNKIMSIIKNVFLLLIFSQLFINLYGIRKKNRLYKKSIYKKKVAPPVVNVKDEQPLGNIQPDMAQKPLYSILLNLLEDIKSKKVHSYDEMTYLLKYYNTSCYSMSYLYSIGTSVQNREIWVIALGKNPQKHTPGVPEVKFVSNIHGNEISGREMLLNLLQIFCDNPHENAELYQLLTKTRLHLVPSVNPDGFEMFLKKNSSKSFIGRLNANGVDINRNFPDQFFPSSHDIEPETKAIIDWMENIPFVLSASFHDGALVVSYPYDDSPSGQTKYSATPDDDIFRRISLTYSENHPILHKGLFENCSNVAQQKRFVGGITNGAEWSSLTNTMQDYNYVNTNCFEVTVQLSCQRFVEINNLNDIFEENKKSIIKFLSIALTGIKGFVKDEHGNYLENVKLSINDRRHDISTWKDGDYWRILLPGTYDISASLPEYQTQIQSISINLGEAEVLNFTLTKKSPDVSLLTLGHVNAAKKISNIITYGSDGRDSFDWIFNSNQGEEPKVVEREETENVQITKLFAKVDRPNLTDNIKNLTKSIFLNKQLKINQTKVEETKVEETFTTTTSTTTTTPKTTTKDKSTESVIESDSEYTINKTRLVCLITKNKKTIKGVIKWLGNIKELNKGDKKPIIAGLEIDKEDDLGTDGSFLGKKYFKTGEKRAYFVPIKVCHKDRN